MHIAFGGLPGTGKTTVARELARRLGAVHVRLLGVDEQVAALVDRLGLDEARTT